MSVRWTVGGNSRNTNSTTELYTEIVTGNRVKGPNLKVVEDLYKRIQKGIRGVLIIQCLI